MFFWVKRRCSVSTTPRGHMFVLWQLLVDFNTILQVFILQYIRSNPYIDTWSMTYLLHIKIYIASSISFSKTFGIMLWELETRIILSLSTPSLAVSIVLDVFHTAFCNIIPHCMVSDDVPHQHIVIIGFPLIRILPQPSTFHTHEMEQQPWTRANELC